MRPKTRSTPTALTLAVATALVLSACGTDLESEVAPEETTTVETPPSEPDDAQTPPSPETTAREASPSGEEGEGSTSEEESEDAAELTDFTAEEQRSENWDDFILEVDHDTIQVITEVRHGVHDGYERVVIEYAESTDLAYRAQYEEPSSEPEASPASLLIDVQGTTGGPEAEQLATLDTLRPETAGVVEAVYPLLPDAGESQIRIGLDEERPFRIHHEEQPVRITIDVATD